MDTEKVKASFTDHLAELRRRILTVLAFLLVTTIISYPLAQPLLVKIKEDLLGDTRLVIIQPQEAIIAYIKVSILIGFALTLPVLSYHLWVFIAPALVKDEKRLVAYLIAPSTFMFILGVAFGYFILLPVALRFLLSSAKPLATPMLSLDAMISFIAYILIALGLVFQMPLITAGLTRLGVLNSETLSQYRRHAIVSLFIVAALVTDPSVITQLILAVPMIILFELSILSSKLVGGKRC